MVDKDELERAIKGRLSRVLLVAESSLPQSQYQAFRKLTLDEFGRNGLGKDLDRILVSGKHSGR